MSQYIHIPFAIALLIAVAWSTFFSLFNNYAIRGYRNLGLLACYIIPIVFLFIAGWKSTMVTWVVFGVSGGLFYTLHEIIIYLRVKDDEKPFIDLGEIIGWLFAWPIMVPEAIENLLAEFGILSRLEDLETTGDPMPSRLEHPDFGILVPDKWNDSLFTLRVFPHMKPFWQREISETGLEEKHREWIDDWEKQLQELSHVSRNGFVHEVLQSRGIYEIYLEVPEHCKRVPSESQAAAYRYFISNEKAICENVVDALLRYYHVAREKRSDCFEDDDYPDEPSVDELGDFINFDGFTVRRSSADGISPLCLSWSPQWDDEHGLLIAVYRDQVVIIGTDEVDDFLNTADEPADYVIWKRIHMTEAEISALKHFMDNFRPADE